MSVFYNESTQPQSQSASYISALPGTKRYFHTTDVWSTLTRPEFAGCFGRCGSSFADPIILAHLIPRVSTRLQVIPVQLAYRVKASRLSRKSKKKVKPKTGSVPNRGHESKTGSEPMRGMALFHYIVLLFVVQLDKGRQVGTIKNR